MASATADSLEPGVEAIRSAVEAAADAAGGAAVAGAAATAEAAGAGAVVEQKHWTHWHKIKGAEEVATLRWSSL